MQTSGSFISQLLARLELVKISKEANFTLPIEDMSRVLDMYYDAEDEISDLQAEVQELVRALNEAEQ